MSAQFQNIPAGAPVRRSDSDHSAINIDGLIEKVAAETSVTSKPALRTGISPAARSSSDSNWTLEGIADNTRVTTSFGEVPVQLLRKNDMLRVRDGSFRRINWVNHFRFDEDFMSKHPAAKPVRVRAGSLGQNLPARDIEISSCTNLMLTTGAGTMPVQAQSLLKRAGVLSIPRTQLSYTQFKCDGGDVDVCAEGVWIRISG